jgi:hypothetical protein
MQHERTNVCRFSLVLHCVISVAIPAGLADAQQAPTHDPTDDGKRVFKAANCMGGHKWHGHGGSGYGGPFHYGVPSLAIAVDFLMP